MSTDNVNFIELIELWLGLLSFECWSWKAAHTVQLAHQNSFILELFTIRLSPVNSAYDGAP